MAVELIPDKPMNHKISHLPGVRASVRRAAYKIAGRARARLAINRYEGHSRITVEHGDTDSLVSLEDPDNAVAIEEGHFHNFTGKYVAGLHVIRHSAGLI